MVIGPGIGVFPPTTFSHVFEFYRRVFCVTGLGGLYMEGLIFGILRYMAKMKNATFAQQKTGGVNNKENVALTMFAIYLIFIIFLFATCLQGANLCKSMFSSRARGETLIWVHLN